MSAANRQAVRDALLPLLQAGLSGAGLTATVGYTYQAVDPTTQNPYLICPDDGTERDRRTFGNTWHNLVFLALHVLVLRANPAASWTQQQSLDRLDLVERVIADVLMDNKSNPGTWDQIDFAGRNALDVKPVAGAAFRREIITIRAEQWHG